MANENKKDFNAMLADDKGMPRIQRIEDAKSIERYGGERMLLAPPAAYDKLMRLVPAGRLVTVGALRERLAREAGADFTDPITAGIFCSIAAWASYQRTSGTGPAPGAYDAPETPWWRTLKAKGELNPKYPGGGELQKELLEAEGHVVVTRGRKNLRYYVEGYEDALFDLEGEGE